jgi:hypothetical protein
MIHCGPSERARRKTSLKRAFAVCSCQRGAGCLSGGLPRRGFFGVVRGFDIALFLMLSRDQIRSRNVFVQSCKDRPIRARKFAQVTISDLLRRFYPTWKMRNIVFVSNECETGGTSLLKAQQQSAGLSDGKSVGRGLG